MTQKIIKILFIFIPILFLGYCNLIESEGDPEGAIDNTPWHTYLGAGDYDVGYDITNIEITRSGTAETCTPPKITLALGNNSFASFAIPNIH